jgi:hypothetical protein
MVPISGPRPSRTLLAYRDPSVNGRPTLGDNRLYLVGQSVQLGRGRHVSGSGTG